MKKDELIKKVQAKIKNRPDMQYVNDEYLSDTLDDALNDVLDYINASEKSDLDEGLATPIKDLCMVRLNLTGSEGLSSSSKAGTSESYLENIPKSIRHKLQKYRSLP